MYKGGYQGGHTPGPCPVPKILVSYRREDSAAYAGRLSDRLAEHLKKHEIGTKVYYPIPLHRQQCFEYLGYAEGSFPESERAARETLALPMFPELTEAQQQYVVETIGSFKI